MNYALSVCIRVHIPKTKYLKHLLLMDFTIRLNSGDQNLKVEFLKLRGMFSWVGPPNIWQERGERIFAYHMLIVWVNAILNHINIEIILSRYDEITLNMILVPGILSHYDNFVDDMSYE
jgi:hypothetical protein